MDQIKFVEDSTAWKVSKYGVFMVRIFPAFGPNTEIYSVNLRIQSKCGKIWTGKNCVFEHFSHSAAFKNYIKLTSYLINNS